MHISSSHTSPASEEATLPNECRNFAGHHFLPGIIAVVDFFQHVARKHRQIFLVKIIQLLDAAPIDQVLVELAQLRGDFKVIVISRICSTGSSAIPCSSLNFSWAQRSMSILTCVTGRKLPRCTRIDFL